MMAVMRHAASRKLVRTGLPVSLGAFVVIACALAGFAAAGGAANETLAKNPPKPAFGSLTVPPASFVVVTQRLSAGQRGEVAVRVTHKTTCGLTLVGPKSMHAGPYV